MRLGVPVLITEIGYLDLTISAQKIWLATMSPPPTTTTAPVPVPTLPPPSAVPVPAPTATSKTAAAAGVGSLMILLIVGAVVLICFSACAAILCYKGLSKRGARPAQEVPAEVMTHAIPLATVQMVQMPNSEQDQAAKKSSISL